MARCKIRVHLPSWVSEDYLEQLGSEKRIPVTDTKTRKTTYKWVKTSGKRNEVLDLWVYALSGGGSSRGSWRPTCQGQMGGSC